MRDFDFDFIFIFIMFCLTCRLSKTLIAYTVIQLNEIFAQTFPTIRRKYYIFAPEASGAKIYE
jgi:hypothetical protein